MLQQQKNGACACSCVYMGRSKRQAGDLKLIVSNQAKSSENKTFQVLGSAARREGRRNQKPDTPERWLVGGPSSGFLNEKDLKARHSLEDALVVCISFPLAGSAL